MSVGRHASAIRPARRHRGDAASADRLARRLGRRRQPRRAAEEHGIAHLLEHMAFKGTARRTARQIAEEIEAVGGDLNAYDQRARPPPITRACWRPTCRSRSTCWPTSCANPTFDPDELEREQNVIVQEIGAGRGHARRPHLRLSAGDAPSRTSRSAARSSARRDACARSTRREPARLSGAQLSRARHGGGGGGRGRSRRGRRRGRAALRRSSPGPAAPLPEPARFGGGARIERATSSRSMSLRAAKACRSAIPTIYSLQVFTNVLGGGMSSRLFQEVRENRGLCYSIYAFHVALRRHRHVRHLCRHRRRATCRS